MPILKPMQKQQHSQMILHINETRLGRVPPAAIELLFATGEGLLEEGVSGNARLASISHVPDVTAGHAGSVLVGVYAAKDTPEGVAAAH